MDIGAAEDLTKSLVLTDSKAQFELAASTGLNAVRVTALWRPGLTAPDPYLVTLFETTSYAASLTGIRLIVSIYPESNRQVPLDAAARAEFASFAAGLARSVPGLVDFIVGNEDNLNFFWLPQYNADGTSAAPKAYTELLAVTYDALEAVNPAINVIGGAVSPAGTDKPKGKRPTHSPGKFILGMGEAYRAMGRTTPIMDEFAFHPYGQRSQTSPSAENPNSTRISLADYGKLVSFLGQAFDGTAQKGSTLPILYDEYGVQSAIPAAKEGLYTEHSSPSAADAVSEAQQAAYYREALELAFCQPNVTGFLFFHTVDEADLGRWQSGLFYPDLTPKTSMPGVRDAILKARRGVLARCPGLGVPVSLLGLEFRAARSLPVANRRWTISAGCVQDCIYIARLEKLPQRSTTLVKSGSLDGGAVRTIALPPRRVAPGLYRLTIRFVSRVNPGEPLTKTSKPLRVG